jgi:hypothetical protein
MDADSFYIQAIGKIFHAYNAILANNAYICISSLTIAFTREGNLYSYRRLPPNPPDEAYGQCRLVKDDLNKQAAPTEL